MGETICGWCGLVEDLAELRGCDIRGEPSQICLRCFAGLSKYMQIYPDAGNVWQRMPVPLVEGA